MKIGIYLSYVGLGANLLHLSYCHQIAKRHGPVTIITLCKNLEEILTDDPLIEKVYYLDKYHKKFLDIFRLSCKLKEFKLDNLLIFYPSLRIYLSAKIANINNIHIYNIFRKKNLHLVSAAKKLTEKFLSIKNCPTETKIFIKKEKLDIVNQELNNNEYFNLVTNINPNTQKYILAIIFEKNKEKWISKRNIEKEFWLR